ncbi:metallo-peptidase Clan MP Family M67 [Leptomonas pyrrhocoris]|uniref:COP9 signalosome complex subunit 5 n=1 Tax=Leptomonas pyrrhocoris TaxID=157538 RepID=A0A0M9FX60_LEPPY|nr:metallo-peptidase Clan MP Family M67 [Leptomonas pyrrhocoris]XP_015656334.1 metallo-peptidase Clan MP Family M67 [Leptomonas pyrrhocoris]XP_015656335.1 metallo-peptidase Clan MP Family M67 [Leptomonas pyrrhocoris]KPA77894.1 metallo-peptidase Clan MP Family M67 [Leptomonas pyrrhocoris]KPA77895.1 metallo-peptidase Clan MP Family M67 [Leptomonas pyrrhocoris]KPA77896.1 metallo-peptidase Clan MP Family M67 [Leptomonas pyrrhocoris]|eukprot:XP_015656333.1 metallo-peptidase Clan MP Family M67 [Leptomonas pyrrhocoris]
MSTPTATSVRRPEKRGGHHWNTSVARITPPSADVPVVSDSYWVPDVEQMDATRRQKPWRADPHFFNAVSVSLAATVKMFMHGTRGCPDISQGRFNWFEVMGLLIGHFRDRELVLTDSFCLPVTASEVECSMTEASQIYMSNYLDYHRRLGKAEPGCVGWYHTHPGYSCFLSGIDVTTQQGSQRMQDPWVALVIDPVETLRTGQFSMKAFRTYPEGYIPPEAAEKASRTEEGEGNDPPPRSFPHSNGLAGASGSSFDPLPTSRIKEFGMHAHRFYELPVKVVQSARDAPLWATLQQHFWPLSLSLTFPFAASTRTCQCCSKELADITAALADLPSGGRAVTTPSSTSAVQRGGRYEPGAMPRLYKSAGSKSREEAIEWAKYSTNREERAEEKKVAVVHHLLTVTRDALQAKSESFSLLNAAQPAQPELLQALRVVSAASKAMHHEEQE